MRIVKDAFYERQERCLEAFYENTEKIPVIDYIPCIDPLCDCGALYAIHELEGEQAALSISVHDQRLFSNEETPLDVVDDDFQRHITEVFRENINDEIWLELEKIYLRKKNIITSEVNPAKIEVEIDKEDILQDEMTMFYEKIFPSAKHLFTLGESLYIFVESYCKAEGCDCEDMILNVGRINEEDIIEPMCAYDYSYRTGRGSFREVKAEEKLISKTVINAFFEEHPGINEMFKARNRIIRKLLQKAKRAYWKNASKSNMQMNVSRNAPCPCGSGRKYKRCCGRGKK